MVEHRVSVKFSLIFYVAFLVGRGICDEEYMLGFNEGVSDCDDFKNDKFKGDGLKLGKVEDDAGGSMFLEGCLEVCEAIQEGTMVSIEIQKETEVGSEPMWSCSMDVCKSLDDEDSPWAEAVKSLEITKCPIEVGKYCCEKFTLDTSFAKDFMNHNFEGNYGTNFMLKDNRQDTQSCHQLGLSIFPVEGK